MFDLARYSQHRIIEFARFESQTTNSRATCFFGNSILTKRGLVLENNADYFAILTLSNQLTGYRKLVKKKTPDKYYRKRSFHKSSHKHPNRYAQHIAGHNNKRSIDTEYRLPRCVIRKQLELVDLVANIGHESAV